MKEVFYLIIVCLILIIVCLITMIELVSCRPTKKYGPQEISIINRTSEAIKVVPQFNYPDTSLRVHDSSVSSVERGMGIAPDSEGRLLNFYRWKRTIEEKEQ